MEGDDLASNDGISDGSEHDHTTPESDSDEEGEAIDRILQSIGSIQGTGPVRDILAARERLCAAQLAPIDLPADAPAEHPLLMEAINLYDDNLVPEEAFRAMIEGEEALFRELIQRGGMLNRSRPNAVERPYYPSDYESVHDQMHSDLTGQSGRPGRYRLMGLRSGTGELVAWMTYRLPPCSSSSFRAKREYGAHVKQVFSRVTLRGIKRYDLPQHFSMMEIDTINVRKGWEGAGTKLLAGTLKTVQENEKECPRYIYFYRFSRLSLKQPNFGAEKNLFSGGENPSSAQLFTSCGFDHIGHRQDEHEVVAREVSNIAAPSVVVLGPMWEYGIGAFETARELSERRLHRFYGAADGK